MAVEDKYVNSLIAADKLAAAANAAGAQMYALIETFEVAAADDDGSVYRVFPNVPSSLVILPNTAKIHHDAITSGTDWDFGVYNVDSGAVVDKDIFADGVDLSSAGTTDAITTVVIENYPKSIMEHLGLTVASSTYKPAYDLCLTANTVGSAAASITVVLLCVQK